MVDGHQRHVIDEVRFPQLGADPHVVGAVSRGQLVAANLDPVFRLRDAGRILRVDPQSQRRSPQEVGDEAACPVPSSANTHGHEPLSRCSATSGWSTGGSNSACGTPFGQTIRVTSIAVRVAQPDVHGRPGDRLLLHEPSRSHFDFAADAERVDALIAGRALRARPNDLIVIAAGARAGQTNRPARREADEIELAVAAEIDRRSTTSASIVCASGLN